MLSCYFLFVTVMLTQSFGKIDSPMCLTENRPKLTETEIPPKLIDFQLFWSVLVENFTNRKFRFWLAKTKKTDRTKPITPLRERHQLPSLALTNMII